MKKSSKLSAARKVARRRWAKTKQKIEWPLHYTNSKTGKEYQSHNDQEEEFVYSDTPRYCLLKGGEGGGKSVAGIVKALDRLKRGMSGIMVSPDLEHFKKSLWPEFKLWCPWSQVVDSQQRLKQSVWQPTKSFTLVFKNGATLICGGAKEDQIGGWEGPNVNFVFFDEARRHKTPAALKTFDGRIRIPGPNGEPPQIWFTTTPRKHWLFEYFAGARGDEESLNLVPEKVREQYADFRANAFVATVLTKENEDAGNLEQGFTKSRAQTLNQSEINELLKAGWEDSSDNEKFVNLIWWDACKEQLPELTRNEPMVIALDAATGSELPGYVADCFAMIGVTLHPYKCKDVKEKCKDIAIRYAGVWQPERGELLNFGPIMVELVRLIKQYNVVKVIYDNYQLHYFRELLLEKGIVHIEQFSQQSLRLEADKALQQMIINRQITHDGNLILRAHANNAYVKRHTDKGIRIVKRTPAMKIDMIICASMAAFEARRLNL